MTNFEKVKEFHNKFGIISPKNTVDITTISSDILDMRNNLIDEEFNELLEAIEQQDIVEVADALTDILYVVYGYGDTLGIDLDECFDEVHRSNMSKLGDDGKPIFRKDGKIMKGKKFFKPNLKSILFDK